MLKISIIVPVYNNEKFIGKCIDSLLNQTYSNIEIIIIDDGSTDNSNKIIDNYHRKFSNIFVIHKSNGGVSSARNIGIEYSTGEKIIFVDSDDYVEEDYVESLVKDKDAKLNIVNYTRDYTNGKKKHQINTNENIENLSISETMELLVSPEPFQGYLWNKCFDAKILRLYDIKFDEKIKICEDLLFCIQYTKHINYASYYHHEVYHYYINSESTMHNQSNDLSVLNAYTQIINITSEFKNCQHIVIERYMSSLYSLFFKNKKFEFNDYKFLIKEKRKYHWKLNLKYLIIYCIYPVFCVLYKIYNKCT